MLPSYIAFNSTMQLTCTRTRAQNAGLQAWMRNLQALKKPPELIASMALPSRPRLHIQVIAKLDQVLEVQIPNLLRQFGNPFEM